jgi:hypothetical protein
MRVSRPEILRLGTQFRGYKVLGRPIGALFEGKIARAGDILLSNLKRNETVTVEYHVNNLIGPARNRDADAKINLEGLIEQAISLDPYLDENSLRLGLVYRFERTDIRIGAGIFPQDNSSLNSLTEIEAVLPVRLADVDLFNGNPIPDEYLRDIAGARRRDTDSLKNLREKWNYIACGQISMKQRVPRGVIDEFADGLRKADYETVISEFKVIGTPVDKKEVSLSFQITYVAKAKEGLLLPIKRIAVQSTYEGIASNYLTITLVNDETIDFDSANPKDEKLIDASFMANGGERLAEVLMDYLRSKAEKKIEDTIRKLNSTRTINILDFFTIIILYLRSYLRIQSARKAIGRSMTVNDRKDILINSLIHELTSPSFSSIPREKMAGIIAYFQGRATNLFGIEQSLLFISEELGLPYFPFLERIYEAFKTSEFEIVLPEEKSKLRDCYMIFHRKKSVAKLLFSNFNGQLQLINERGVSVNDDRLKDIEKILKAVLADKYSISSLEQGYVFDVTFTPKQ